MFTTLAIGAGTLGGALIVSKTMYVRTMRKLAPEGRAKVLAILHRFRLFEAFPVILLITYFVTKAVYPDYRLLVIFLSWAAYNVYLLFKMRWVMAAFRRAKVSLDFQVGYVFAGMVAYSGLVSSLLVLYQGGHL